VSSQVDIHRKYGGVVPELASRAHLERIVPVAREALERAGLTYNDMDAIAVTQGPGLVGALLVGLSYAKALAFALGKPLIAVNHLEGHIHACLLEEAQTGAKARSIGFPVVALVVSGGHTSLYRVERVPRESSLPGDTNVLDDVRYDYDVLGQTLDDAAGEAYDKVAKLLGLGYPGGPVMDHLAPLGNANAVSFTAPKMKSGRLYDFSFSGIKTSVARFVKKEGLTAEAERRTQQLTDKLQGNLAELCSQKTLDLVASFQRCVVDDLVRRTFMAADDLGVEAIFISGGVAGRR